MNILALDAASDRIGLALKFGEKRDFFLGEAGKKSHSKNLLTQIEKLLEKNGVSPADIDVFGVVVGPGSFTGIRIGVATINAFAAALGKKTVSVTGPELFASEDKPALVSCGHGEYYAGEIRDGEIVYSVMTEEEAECFPAKTYITGPSPEILLKKCEEKAAAGDFTGQAKPFYLKKSSAERNFDKQ